MAAPTPRSVLATLPRYVAGRRADEASIARLASNESHHAPLPSVVEAIATAAAEAHRYPDIAATDTRARIAATFGVTVDQVALGPGSVGLLQQLISAFCDPGDEVVFAWRSFEAYPILCRIAGAVDVAVPLRADESHDLDAMRAAITDRTRVVLLCTPNNPTGVAIPPAELEAFVAAVPSDVLVVVDEAYVEYEHGGMTLGTVPLIAAHPHVCVLRTFSKAHGLAGLRIGYAIAAPEVAEALRSTALPFAVTDLAQVAAVRSLECAAELAVRVKEVAAERDRMVEALRSARWTLPHSDANFVWLRMPDQDRERLVDRLDEAGILVRGYAGDGVRITIADRATNDRVLAALGVAP